MVEEKEEPTIILLCEDDLSLGGLLAEYLRRLGYEVVHCADGEKALQTFRERHFDLCLSDINMPQKNGLELLNDIRSSGSEIPFIFLTERKATEDIIRAYQLGCDEYLTKPCPIDILLYKIKAIMRRCVIKQRNQEVEFDLGNGIHFDAVTQMLGNRRLTARENDVLLILCRRKNELVERNFILHTLWAQESYFASRSLSVYINHLRNYLAGTQVAIQSVHGKGYKLIQL